MTGMAGDEEAGDAGAGAVDWAWGHPVLRWMVDNVAVVKDGKREYQTAQEKSRNKIDGVVATINAPDVEIHQVGFLSVYERRGCWRYE